ncbi:sensor histidine kinase [Paenibacillus mendelii]|uniref:histidine kinase n=1 Tax=Paenibacillus mendelii TaxID=206163 RepID=A0ABV6J8P7_9BACL|nr:histidine kinase [Paenibacillus mendelii]MCQ6561435.1 histidine kinase [Paenibacillus mendelii]
MKIQLLHSIKSRMTLAFLLVNLLSLVLALSIASHLFNNVAAKDFMRLSGDAASRFNYDIDFYIKRLMQSTAGFMASKDVQAYLKQEKSTPEETEAIENELQKFAATDRPEIAGMFLMSKQSNMISIFSYYYSRTGFYSNEPWFSLPFRSEPQIIPTHYTNYPNQSKYAVVSVVIPIFDIDSIEIIGRLVVDVIPKQVIETFGEAGLGERGYPLVVSSDDIVVYHPDDTYVGKPRSATPLSSFQLQKGADEAYKQEWNGESWYVSVNQSNRMNWNIVSIVPTSQMEEGLKAVRNAIYVSFLVVSLIIMAVVPLLTHQFVKRVVRLKNMMAMVAMGDLKVRAKLEKRQDEFQYLYLGFNNMVSRLQQLMGEVYELQMKEMRLELRQKEALIRALQNQINPHLLYNTLGIIKSMAYFENVPKIELIARNLADVYRYTARFEQAEVTLREELDIMTKYFEIIHLRFPINFSRSVFVNDRFHDCLCMKLTLQPIVENAVKYAIEPNGGAGAIIVSAYGDEGDLVIEIADNGKGIPAPQLEEIHLMLTEAASMRSADAVPNPHSSLGLANVHARLVLKYGERYGIRIDSFIGKGTVVSVRIPMRPADSDQLRGNESEIVKSDKAS